MKKTIILLLFILLTVYAVTAQTVTITGVVTSQEDGTPVPGANIQVKGTTFGAFSGVNGEYSLNVPSGSNTIVFSYIGMQTQEVEISGRSKVDVVMKPDILLVDEVIVVAYGTTRKEAFTGSASSVKGEKLVEIQVSNVTKALEGLSSGIQVVSGSGQPGTTSNVRIRGIGSINASTAPLYVIDGFPFDGDISSIPQSDIASVTVLKDASATALYGSRAANGVIVLTTKRGRSNENQLSFSANAGFNVRGIPEYDRVNVPQYYELTWENLYNAQMVAGGATDEEARTYATNNLINMLGDYNAYNVPDNQVVGTDGKINPNAKLLWTDNWYDEMHRVGMKQDYTLAASGGNNKSTYYISGNYLKDNGIVKASNYDRFTIRLNAETQAREWMKVGISTAASTSSQNYPASSGSNYVNSFMWSRMIAPIYPVYVYDTNGVVQTDASGNKLYDYGDALGRARPFGSAVNPLGVIALDRRIFQSDNLQAKGFLKLDFLRDFSLTLNGNADYTGRMNIRHQNSEHGDAESFSGRSTRTANRRLTFSANQILTFNKTFRDHNVDFLAGHESSMLRFNELEGVKSGFPFSGLYELDAAATLEDASSFEDNFRMESWLSRLNYNFRNRYYLSLSARTDGSSRFAADYRWGNFWSVGASWRITEEDFLSGISWLNDLKIKASYGSQGNDNLGTYYAYLGLYSLGYNNVNYPGLVANRLATPELLWEKNKSLNAGIEIMVFDRLNVNLEIYKRESDDLLFDVPLPASTGYASYDANVGAMQNTGFDLEAGVIILNKSKLRWSTDLNLSHYKNEITRLPEGQDKIIRGTKQLMVGHSIYDFFTFRYLGVNDQGDPTWQREDTEGNLTTVTDYSQATRFYTGTSSIPDFTGGVTNTFRAGAFDLSFLVTFAAGGQIYDGSYAGLMGQTLGDNFHVDALNRWTPENNTSNIPRLRQLTNANVASDRWLISSDYLSFRNLSLGFNIPKKFASPAGITNARITATITNLHMFTARKGLDPQQSFDGTTDNAYTPLRTTTISLNINF